jgi:glutathione transport system substrate-binding protein
VAPTVDAIAPNPAGSGLNSTIQGNLYDALYRNTTSNGLEDWLAEKTTISADGLMWTLTLRSGVKFHDGTDFDAAAVKTNLETRRNSASFPLKGQLAPLQQVNVVDSRTVQLVLTQASASLRAVLANSRFGIQSPTAMSTYRGAEYLQHAAGTGPFKLDGAQTERVVTLARNPDYWGPKPYLDKLELRTQSDETSALAALEAGDTQGAFNVPLADVPRLKREGKVTLVQKTPANSYVFFNTSKTPVADKRVRQALVYGLNSNAYLAVTSELGKKAFALVPSTTPGYAAQTPYSYDPARAKQMLADAGIQPGLTLNMIAAGNQFYGDMAQLIGQDLEAIGVKTILRVMPTTEILPTLMSAAENTQWHICVYGATLPYGDAEAIFFRLLYGPNDAPNGNNWSHYKNDTLDKLLVQQQGLVDPTERARALAEIQKLTWDEVPMFSPLEFALTSATSKKVQDVTLAQGDGLLFGRTWIAA